MTSNWKKKRFFTLRSKRNSEIDTEINNLDMSSEEIVEKLSDMTKECNQKMKSLILHLEMNNKLMADIQLKHTSARSELKELKTEIYKNTETRALFFDEQRNLDARFISLETELFLAQGKLQSAQINSEINLKTNLSLLKIRIKAMKKMTSSNRT